MANLDVFSADAFTMSSMTDAINLLPYKPKMLGSMGIFTEKRIRTTVCWVESKEGKLALVSTGVRGTIPPANVNSPPDRKARPFKVPHIPKFMTFIADDIQNIRAFGSETELEIVSEAVNDRIAQMRDELETTQEFHRVNALKGILVDADNSTVLFNFYTEFDTTQQTSNFVASTGDPNLVVTDVIRKIATALGNDTFSLVIALCGNTYFDQVVQHAKTKTAYERWQDGGFLRMSHLGPQWYSIAPQGFMLQNVLFVNYRGTIGDVVFVPDTEAYFFPADVPGMFQEIIAPADTMSTVNTLGRRFYAFKNMIAYEKGVELHTQTNFLGMNTRPRAVIKSTYSA